MEVEDPREAITKRKQDEALARVRRFCALGETRGFSLRGFDFNYRQPKLSTEDPDGSERRLLLLSAKTHAEAIDTSPEQRRSEAVALISFIYTRIYPEGYSADPEEARAYKAYCGSLRDQEVATLPLTVRTLSLKQLVAHARAHLSSNSTAHQPANTAVPTIGTVTE
jgi:hypothetical protein